MRTEHFLLLHSKATSDARSSVWPQLLIHMHWPAVVPMQTSRTCFESSPYSDMITWSLPIPNREERQGSYKGLIDCRWVHCIMTGQCTLPIELREGRADEYGRR